MKTKEPTETNIQHPTTNVERGRVLVGSYCVSRRFAAVQHRGNRQTRSAWSASGLPALWIGPYRGARLRDGLHMESGAEARALHTLRASPGPLPWLSPQQTWL